MYRRTIKAFLSNGLKSSAFNFALTLLLSAKCSRSRTIILINIELYD